MNDRDRQELIAAALEAQKRFYAPYSNFPVGAAIRTASGKIYQGCNVENASYGLTICAERVAATSAVAAGDKEFVAVAVVSKGGVSPCGACRQFLAEFNPSVEIVMIDSQKPCEIHEASLAQLLPGRFDKADIDRAK
jgi:cytidine deaminase